MKHDTLEQNRFAAWMNDKGNSAIRRRGPKLESIKSNDPLRIEARELLAATMENLAVAFVMERRHAHLVDEQRAEMGVAMKEAETEKIHKAWGSHNVKKFEGAMTFADQHLGGVALQGRRRVRRRRSCVDGVGSRHDVVTRTTSGDGDDTKSQDGGKRSK